MAPVFRSTYCTFKQLIETTHIYIHPAHAYNSFTCTYTQTPYANTTNIYIYTPNTPYTHPLAYANHNHIMHYTCCTHISTYTHDIPSHFLNHTSHNCTTPTHITYCTHTYCTNYTCTNLLRVYPQSHKPQLHHFTHHSLLLLRSIIENLSKVQCLLFSQIDNLHRFTEFGTPLCISDATTTSLLHTLPLLLLANLNMCCLVR